MGKIRGNKNMEDKLQRWHVTDTFKIKQETGLDENAWCTTQCCIGSCCWHIYFPLGELIKFYSSLFYCVSIVLFYSIKRFKISFPSQFVFLVLSNWLNEVRLTPATQITYQDQLYFVCLCQPTILPLVECIIPTSTYTCGWQTVYRMSFYNSIICSETIPLWPTVAIELLMSIYTDKKKLVITTILVHYFQ